MRPAAGNVELEGKRCVDWPPTAPPPSNTLTEYGCGDGIHGCDIGDESAGHIDSGGFLDVLSRTSRRPGEGSMRRRSTVALLAALMVMAMTLGASAAFAGEITGNGTPLWTGDNPLPTDDHHTLNGKSLCAFSGQEDGQFFDHDGEAVDPVVKGRSGPCAVVGTDPQAHPGYFPVLRASGQRMQPEWRVPRVGTQQATS